MRFSSKKSELFALLSRVNNIVEKKSPQKIRTNVLIRAVDDRIELVGFDNEMTIAGSVAATVEENGETTVTAQKLFDIVRSLSSETDVVFHQTDNVLYVQAGSSKFQLVTLPVEDYPLPERYEFEQQFELPAVQLVDLLSRVKFSMATNDVRHYLNGLLLHFTPSAIIAVSTDGHRLSIAEIENNSDITDRKVIIPKKAIGEIINWLSGESDSLKIELSDTHIQFCYQQVEMTSALINAEYPAYESVIPSLSENPAIIPKATLKTALQRAKILSNEYGSGVSLSFSPWTLHLSAKNMDNEMAEDKIDMNYDGENMRIAFNINYLVDILDALSHDNVTMSVTDSQSSSLIYDTENDNARYVLMPMNI
ncbi:DNA polymerase III subunit beta [Ostreibacterium oceani]|uniref:Beta sliding clamp n=1 Tax=Ostreibacterium oceani TaxID=2654998 RepID=A0A6N7EW32_9GAMM|nr:DNA polymerase III subunit beta [Ostreibacterium oceani]MPV85297.1 DNA polymerase III subunit beta [Ostreibacterium oceani]